MHCLQGLNKFIYDINRDVLLVEKIRLACVTTNSNISSGCLLSQRRLRSNVTLCEISSGYTLFEKIKTNIQGMNAS